MQSKLVVRAVQAQDYAGWRPLWDGYNAFYGREGDSALSEATTAQTWARFFDPQEPVAALVAELDGQLVGIAHTVMQRSTTRLDDVCYLQDLFTAAHARGQGVARALIHAVYQRAQANGACQVYWRTHEGNHRARALYDQMAQFQGGIVYTHELAQAKKPAP